MTELTYTFGDLDIHAAITVQGAITRRRQTIETTSPDHKTQRALLNEIDILYDDLDRHIAACVKQQEYERIGKTIDRNG